jgi:trimeric autotransporter adhesin
VKSEDTIHVILKNNDNNDKAILYQNIPNPFDNSTTIKYFVPDNTDAKIIFYDMFGNLLKSFNITENGNGHLNIDAINLSAGAYAYSLSIRGKIVDTKKMIKQ